MTTKLWDKYLAHPLVWDGILALALVVLLHFLAPYLLLATLDVPTVLDSLASTTISLAGFILTGLTIIASIRANLAYKGLEQSNTGLELLFNSWAYRKIVEVFRGAIQGLIIGACILYTVMIFSKNITERHLLLVSVGVFVEIIGSISRCLYILFRIISIEIQAGEKED